MTGSRLLVALAVSMLALSAFTVLSYDAPILAALGPPLGAAITIGALLGSIWLRERLVQRGAKGSA